MKRSRRPPSAHPCRTVTGRTTQTGDVNRDRAYANHEFRAIIDLSGRLALTHGGIHRVAGEFVDFGHEVTSARSQYIIRRVLRLLSSADRPHLHPTLNDLGILETKRH